MGKITNDLIQNVISEYLNGEEVNNLANKYNIGKTTIRSFLKLHNVFKNRVKFDFKGKENNIITEYLAGCNSIELGKKYGCCGLTIRRLLVANNIRTRSVGESKRKYKINETFFDTIDSPNKAYFLGFLFADGNNSIINNTIRIKLQSRDKYILEKFSSLIFNEYRPLFYIKSQDFFDKDYKKIYNRGEQYGLNICNQYMSKILEKHGMVNAKSLILKFPTCVPDNLLSHFIRGYFDGDGCIGFFQKDYCNIQILGTKLFCNTLQSILQKNDIECKVYLVKGKFTNRADLYQLQIIKDSSCRLFLNYIYNNAESYLIRKYEKYQKLITIKPKSKRYSESFVGEYSKLCSICGGKYYARGYCRKHYYDFFRKPRNQELKIK